MELPDENPFEVKNVSNTKEKIKKLVNDINAVNIGSGAYYNGAKNNICFISIINFYSNIKTKV